MRRYCRECCCFVRSIYARCGHCGYKHDRENLATEEPIRRRRRNARQIPVRGYVR